MSTSLSVELALSHCGARARSLTPSWSEKAELRRVIDEHAVQLRDLCAVSGAKRRSCTNTERTHHASLQHTRKPDVGVAGGLCAGNTCAGNICAPQPHDNPHSNWLLRFVGLLLVRRKQLTRPAIRGIDCARTIHALTQRRQRPAGLSWLCRCLYSRYRLRQTRGEPASSELRLRVRAEPARRRRGARLGGMQRGMTVCESDSNSERAGAPEEARRVWTRKRDRRRRRRNCTDAITWSRRLFLSSPLGARHNVGAYALSLLALSILSPRLRRSHDAFSQHCGLRPLPRLPIDSRARARRIRPRSCCLGISKVEDG
jgi:hypothetical protein